MRMLTKEVSIGNVKIGGKNPIAIQSMTNTKTEDVTATVAQILELEKAGCDIIRCAVPTMEAAKALKDIKEEIHIPLVADIHFDYRLAMASVENGADKIRINPGNIGSPERIQAVVDCCREKNIPIRVGVNSGSLEKDLVAKYHGVTAEGIVESACQKVGMIEKFGYDNLVVSIKSSDVMMSIKAHELAAKKLPYPLHVGITESGTVYTGSIKSAVGLGCILYQGIGDTIRVSLTGDPVQEIYAAKTKMCIRDRHKYEKVYQSDAGYRRNLDKLQALFHSKFGVWCTLSRFPGGSSNTVSRHYNKGIMTRLSKKVGTWGYKYFDWNVSSSDAGGAKNAGQDVYKRQD